MGLHRALANGFAGLANGFAGLAIGFAFLAAAGCGGLSDGREYTLQGQVLSVAADHTEATIKHEDIKGLMKAMTMPYKVRDARQLAGLKPGDLITSTLVVVSNDAYLKDVKRVGEAPLEKTSGETAPASSGFELLKPGEAVPNAPFLDQDGKTHDFTYFKKTNAVATFIYTRCPLPTFCPLMDRHFATIQGTLKSDPSLKRVHLVSMSFDPLTDTPAVLKKHAMELGADPEYWTFLTGDRDVIDRFAMRFGVSVSREMNDPLNITHTLRTAIIDAKGNFVKAYAGNEWTPEQVLTDLRHVEK
jgi:protein SCO1/2